MPSKIRCLLLVVFLLLGGTACGGKGVTAPDPSAIDTEPAPFPKQQGLPADAQANPPTE